MGAPDYVTVNQDLMFSNSSSVVQISVSIVNDNAVENPLEFFTGNLKTTDSSVDLAPDSVKVDIREMQNDNGKLWVSTNH